MAEGITTIGIHVCGRTVRRAEVVQNGTDVCVSRLDLRPLALVGAGTRQAVHPTGGGAGRVVAALPGIDVMTRCWVMPESEDAKLRQMLVHRLEAESPVPLEQLAWAYRVGMRLNGQPTRPVLVQAARHQRIEQHLAALASAGCSPEVVTSESEALAALCKYGLVTRESGGAELLVLAGQDEWVACVSIDGLVHAVRHIRAGSDRFELACRELSQFAETQSEDTPLKRIRWCQGTPSSLAAETAAPQEAMARVSELLEAPVEIVEAAPAVLKAGGGRLGSEDLAVFGPAIGLALADLAGDASLIRLTQTREKAGPSDRLERWFRDPWRWTAAAVALLVLALAIHVLAIRSEAGRMRAALAEGPITKGVELDPKVQAMRRLERYRIDVEGIMAELSRTIPPGVIITCVQLSREHRLVLRGTSGDPKAIFTWADALRKRPRFATVNPERTAPAQGGDFTITAELSGVEKLSTVSGRGGGWR